MENKNKESFTKSIKSEKPGEIQPNQESNENLICTKKGFITCLLKNNALIQK